MTASPTVQYLTLLCVTEAQCNRTSSNEPYQHQPGGSQPPLSVNPTRNIHMGELAHAAPMQPPNHSAHQARPPPETLSRHLQHQYPLTPTQPVDPTPVRRVRGRPRIPRRPRGISNMGLKQAMGLHLTDESKHAYNKFRV